MTAQLRVITGGVADRNTVAEVDFAMQQLARNRLSERRPADHKPPLALVPLEAVPVPRSAPCACGRATCPANELYHDYLRLKAAWDADKSQPYTLVALAWRAYLIAADACFARICPHLKPTDRDIVTVAGVDLDSGMIGNIRYLVSKDGDEIAVTPLPGQDITEEDGEFYRDAARGQWELERGL